jgi:small conductance mechanosensitive channel
MEWEASKTLVWLLVIPLIAFITIRIVTFMGNRAIKKAHTESENNNVQDREERVKMLVHVFSIGWKVLVSLLAIIYMFKAVNVDVLPIIASAGVLGLAIAFGAQQLVRDFFSGFFILLENQFRVGDNVTINGLRGEVERITPRITMVRSLTEGSLHYIPNGSIDHVSNNSREWSAILVTFPISYDAEHEKVLACLQQAADEMRATEAYGKYIYDFINRGLDSFGEFALEYSVKFQCKSGEQAGIAREYRRYAKRLLHDNGIEIASLANLSNMPLSAMKSAPKKEG